MNIDSVVYQNGLLILLVGSFFLFILCVFCIGAFADRGLCCHEHQDIRLQRLQQLRTRELFEHTCLAMPQMFRHIAEIDTHDDKNKSVQNSDSYQGAPLANGEIGELYIDLIRF